MRIPSREHESRSIPVRFAALFAAIALALCCTLPLAACESDSFSGAQTSNPAAVQIADIPEYSGALCIDINNSEPGFTDDDFKRGAFMEFSDLDFEGRYGSAFARIGTDTLSNAPRGDISQVYPSGWEQHRYDFVDQEMLYNRSHLIAHQLCGEDANEKNLITGTRTMNSVGMNKRAPWRIGRRRAAKTRLIGQKVCLDRTHVPLTLIQPEREGVLAVEFFPDSPVTPFRPPIALLRG